jgi:hypothetical protein
MEKYYIMVINNFDDITYELGICYELGEYYEFIGKNYSPSDGCASRNYDEMEKYYLMEIKNGNDYYKFKSISNLSNYYQTIKKYSPLEIYTRLYNTMK